MPNNAFSKTIIAAPRRAAARLRNFLLNIHAKKVGAGNSRLPGLGGSPGARVCVFGHPKHFAPDGRKHTLRILCNSDNIFSAAKLRNLFFCDYTILHYLRDDHSLPKQIIALLCSITGIQKLYFVEPSFLSSILGYTSNSSYPLQFRQICSYFIDDMGFYFDATAGSRVEQLLNSSQFILTPVEKEQCSRLMRSIVKNRLTKYNFQPETRLELGDKKGKKVLIVDQTVADASVWRAYGDDEVFQVMLRDALSENADATVYIKTHPDMHLNARSCYYQSLSLGPEEMNRVRVIDVPCNPYTIIDCMDMVYVCTSQLGFEALMAGKRVKTYGMPIYAGWGLTEDRLTCARRTRPRTLEELFCALYIKLAVHMVPGKNQRVDLETHIASIARLAGAFRTESCSVKT